MINNGSIYLMCILAGLWTACPCWKEMVSCDGHHGRNEAAAGTSWISFLVWFYDYVNMHSKRMQHVLYTTCSSAYQPDDNSTIGRGRGRYIFQNVSLTIKSRHLSWRRYMLLLGRTCRRGAHVQAVDQTTLKTEGTEATWGMSYPVSAILDTRHR